MKVAKLNIEYPIGVIKFSEYLKHHEIKEFGWAKSIIVVLFPYQSKKEYGNYLGARFSYGKDYHIVLNNFLDDFSKKLQLNYYKVLVDTSPINEKLAAYLAGLGFIGKNTLLINKIYGSYVLIGTIVTDKEFTIYNEPINDTCRDCNLCIKACPTGALNKDFKKKRCLSYLTQTKSQDYKLYNHLKENYYGCDICQEVCPYNQESHHYLKELSFSNDNELNIKIMENMTKGEYLKKIQNKNFQWIGYLKMLRNIIVLEANNNNIDIEKIKYYQKLYDDVLWFREHLRYLIERKANES